MMDERPAGWYRDPDNARAHRYWNGQGWMVLQTVPAQTVSTQTVSVQGVDEPDSE